MPTALLPLKPQQSSIRSRRRAGQASKTENRLIQTAKEQRSSRLDNPRWQPYRNAPQLAQQVHDLTHPDEPTFAELEREAALADALKPYETAVIRLSESLRGEPTM